MIKLRMTIETSDADDRVVVVVVVVVVMMGPKRSPEVAVKLALCV